MNGGEPREVLAYHYDREGRLVDVWDALRGHWHYDYDATHQLTRQVNRRGYGVRYEYDPTGKCVHAAGDDGRYESWLDYPRVGLTRVRYADGTWSYEYNSEGTVTRIVGPDGQVTHRLLRPDGLVREEVLPAGRRLQWVHDGDGTTIGRIDPFGRWMASLRLTEELPDPSTPSLPTTHAGWCLGRYGAVDADRAPDPQSPLLAYVPPALLPAAQRALSIGDRSVDADRIVARERDVLGRLTCERDAAGRELRVSYDAEGEPVQIVDRDGCSTTFRNEALDLVARVADGNDARTRFEHSGFGEVVRVQDAGGAVTEYDRDGHDRIVAVRRHGRVRERYVWSSQGTLSRKLDGDGRELVQYVFADRGQLTWRRTATRGEIHTFGYDAQGRLREAESPGRRVSVRHDPAGRRLADLVNGRGVEHGYADEQLIRTRFLGRYEARFEREATGFVAIIDPAGRAHRLRRDGGGMVLRQAPSGTLELSRWDRAGRCRGRITWRSVAQGAPDAWTVQNTWSAEGDLLAVDDSVRGLTRYRVDRAHRLVEEQTPDERHAIALDPAGNVLRKRGIRQVALAEGNRLAQADDEAFTYNARNHVAERTRPPGGSTRYRYSDLDWLVAVDLPDGARWTAEYDGLGRRVSAGVGATQTTFWWDGERLAAEVSPRGVMRVYVYADAAALVPLGFVDYDSLDTDPASGRSYAVYANHLGMPVLVEDAAGRVVWRATDIDPYGAVEIAADATIELNLRWPGHYFDAATGLHYNRFRYYDPHLGRYVQTDPLGIAGGINLHAAPANPVATVDLRGLSDGCSRPGSGSTQGVPATGSPTEQSLNRRGLTVAQDNEFDARIAAAATAEEADNIRYERSMLGQRQRGMEVWTREHWQRETDALRRRDLVGNAREAVNREALRRDLGLPFTNNNRGTTVMHGGNRADSVLRAPDGTIIGSHDSKHFTGEGRQVAFDTNQMRNERAIIQDPDGRHYVTLSSDRPDLAAGEPRPSGPLAEMSAVYYVDESGRITHEWDRVRDRWRAFTPTTPGAPPND